VCPAEITDAAAVEEVARRAVTELGRLDVWVNAASVMLFGPFQQIPPADFRRTLDVNIMGYVHGARAALPHLRDGGGVLVNISSVLGAVTMPYGHPYTMSKWAIRALSAGLRQELALDGAHDVHVCTIMPSTIDTPIFARAANYTGRAVVALPPVYTPERVARAIISVVRRPRREVIVGPMGRALAAQAKLAPGLTERTLASYVHLAVLRKKPALPSAGNLYHSADGSGDVHGSWHGRRRTALRRVGMAAATVGGVAGLRRRLGT
jgi:NAD(P)-dependent dehydrogenase (short-subunit alcohol dehydrogenase family)